MTEWSITRSTGTSGLTFSGVAAEPGDAVAHGGEIDHGRNAREILHQDAGRLEGYFLGRCRC